MRKISSIQNLNASLRSALALSAIFCLALIVTACGRENIQDNLQQQRDRDRASANQLYNEYKTMEGKYTTDEKLDASKYWFELDVKIVSVQTATSTVPQPTLTGDFLSWSKDTNSTESTTMSDSKPVTFPFSDGTYDPGSNLLAITLSSSSTNTIYISCKTQTVNYLQCLWIPTGGQVKQFAFMLRKN